MNIKKIIILIIFILSTEAHANWLSDIASGIANSNVITLNILKGQQIALGLMQKDLLTQQNIYSSQLQIESLMKQVNGDLTGNSGWGNFGFHDYQSYGTSGSDWSNVIALSQSGGGIGQLAERIAVTSKQFPIDTYAYNRSTTHSNSQKYYALKSQTVIAARAASELDYNKIQNQIAYQQMLQQQIERTKDLKAASDLSNRINVEGNLINLEILRQIAILNQQKAVTEQATVNTALMNARFLTK